MGFETAERASLGRASGGGAVSGEPWTARISRNTSANSRSNSSARLTSGSYGFMAAESESILHPRRRRSESRDGLSFAPSELIQCSTR